MSSVVKVTSRIGSAKVVNIVRPLKVEDLDIRIVEPTSEVHWAGSSIKTEVVGSLKPEVATEILNEIKVKTYDNGNFTDSRSPMFHLFENAKETPDLVIERTVIAQANVSMRGVKQDKQQAKFYGIREELMKETEEHSAGAIDMFVSRMNKRLERLVKEINKEFSDRLTQLVVDGNVSDSWYKKNLTETESNHVKESEDEIKALEIQIEKLRKQRDAARDAIYKTKRNRVTEDLKSSLCEEGNKMLDALKDVEKEETFSLFGQM